MAYSTKSIDKSVRDWSVTAEKGDYIKITLKLSRHKVAELFVDPKEWLNPPGDTWGNKDYDRRELMRVTMEATGHFSFVDENACLSERLADSCCTAMYKLMGGIS